ncbi:MAG: hypothetical protein P8J50_00965 [Acidimicrobiales bacterium]|jgi:hypothetical protein|nr:hypothetical protein [Acidimicrobiales bacterium]
MATPPLVAWMNPLPMELAPALAGRRRALAERAAGRVLDLGGWNDHLSAYRFGTGENDVESVVMLDRAGDVRAGTGRDDPHGVTRIDAGPDALADLDQGPFESIVSLIRTPLVADFDWMLRTLFDLLADEGSIYLLEPVRRSGRFGRLLALGGSVNCAAGGLHLDRDIPADMRERGMVVTNLSRFEVPTLSAPMRPFIEATARWPARS